jgi:hypothetical protein
MSPTWKKRMTERQLATQLNHEACEFFNSRIGGLFYIVSNIDFSKHPLGERRKFIEACLLTKVYTAIDYDALCIHNLRTGLPQPSYYTFFSKEDIPNEGRAIIEFLINDELVMAKFPPSWCSFKNEEE